MIVERMAVKRITEVISQKKEKEFVYLFNGKEQNAYRQQSSSEDGNDSAGIYDDADGGASDDDRRGIGIQRQEGKHLYDP